MKIKSITARQIFDSRGIPTVEAKVTLENGITGKASVPSGASTGRYEAYEKRDNKSSYGGKSVFNAVEWVNNDINDLLKGVDVLNQRGIDNLMIDLDGTENKRKLGANATLSVSLACSRAAANALKVPLFFYLGGTNAGLLPIPFMNIINGGKHADNNLNIQEFMIAPTGAKTFEEAMQMGTEVYHTLKSILKEKGLSTSVGDEGGFAPLLKSDNEAIELIINAIEKTGYTPAKDINIALDCAASEWYSDGEYTMLKSGEKFTPVELSDYLASLINNYPIVSIEDPFSEDDFDSYTDFAETDIIQVVGDDLFVTNTKRLILGIENEAANAILIKPNQIGTLSETLDTIKLAKMNNYKVMISHRSGETEDDFIADLAVGTGAGQIKAGAPCRSERLSKYNRLLKIEKMLGKNAVYRSLI
jgi:enolase